MENQILIYLELDFESIFTGFKWWVFCYLYYKFKVNEQSFKYLQCKYK